MPLSPAALPVLLAGPVLRRVESDLVSVWIATSIPCDVSLLLFEGGDVVASQTVDEDQRARWVSARQPTVEVGANLHVLTVVLDLRTSGGNAVRAAGATLDANRTFSYDLRLFDLRDPGAAPRNLRDLGLLDTPFPLGYDPGELPSFKTCPHELDKLVIVHGSCRQMFAVPPLEDEPSPDEDQFKPPPDWPRKEVEPDYPRHDGDPDPFPWKEYPQLPKRDGLLWVDTLVEARGPARIADRPHQLFLTGDQIYADQVPSTLLPALNKLARLLVGDEELGADPTGTVFKPATLEHFPPAFRGPIVRRSAGFTTSDGESHLLSFGEFVTYYLLTWSPELWKIPVVDLWPDQSEFNPATMQAPEDWVIRFLYNSEPVDPESRSEDNFTDDYITLRKHLPVKDEAFRPSPELENVAPEEHAAWFFQQRRDWLASKIWSPDLLEWWTRRFRSGLPRVRRALANVPTYMVADDHDISDDWYFSRQWREQVFTRPLGVDILRNGLMACALMQSWGNDPRRWATGPERELIGLVGPYARDMSAAVAGGRRFAREGLDRIHELLGLPQRAAASPPTFRSLLEFSFQVEAPSHRVLAVDGRMKRRFPFRTSQAGGIDYEGANGLINDTLPTGLPGEDATGLFFDSPMAASLPPRPDGDTKLTIVVTGVPIIGPEGMELTLVPFQRFARLLGSVDAESWAYEPATYEAMLAAMARYGSVVVLSGDVHIGWSAALDYWSAPKGEPVSTARIVQLVSSGFTKDWSSYAPALRGNALTADVFEAATNPALMHAERVGWGSPLRTALTPPLVLGPFVTDPARAHPFYRARLKMRAPVVPTHGWPKGTKEASEPNWAWRAVMGRDERPESTLPPNATRRWTPVELPANPVDPSRIGWHAHAVRRMAVGRVFPAQANVGIVTFEPDGSSWKVRHVLGGELFPLADTGVTPTGLQPYTIHQFTLAPLPPETWTSQRPKIVDDEGWGVDATEPIFELLLRCLPRIWQGSAEFVGAVFDELPPVVDDVTREALLTDAATRMSRPFRRRVLRELGPNALLPDPAIDALTADNVNALLPEVGRLDVDKEARALVRSDLERLLLFHQSLADPASTFDDLLLLACSEWVNDRNRAISMTAGILATFRSPVTRHVPVLAGLLGGLWDLWRNRTFAEQSEGDPFFGFLTGMARAAIFLFRLVTEIVNNVIQDHDPRPSGGPPIFTPELVAGAIGAWQSLGENKRFTFGSGWEPRATPTAPGTRADGRTAESMARQTLTWLIHPGGRARFTRPARNISFTMIPPPGPQDENPPHGSLLVGWDGGLEAEEEIGAGFIARVELDAKGYHQFLWGGSRNIEGRAGGTFRVTVLRPTVIEFLPGADITLTPAASLAIGVKAGVEEGSYKPALSLRLALNDREDRITFRPDDDLLVQLLPSEGLSLPLDAAFEWTLERGWRFAGLAALAGGVLVDDEAPQLGEPERDPRADFDDPPSDARPTAEVVTPLNKRLGILTFHERRLEVTTSADGDGAALNVSVTATVSLNIGPVRVAISGLGVRGTLHLASEFENVDELFDISFSVPMPTGLAVSVDTDVLSGGGFLQRIESPDGRVTWRGGIALQLGDRYDVSAWGVVETGAGRAWTLLAFLVVRFSPPIYLTAGLKLVALGGLIALNRTMNVNALRDAATGSQGTLDPLLFPDRPEQRFLELLPAVERFFPPAKGHQVVGLMAEIEWRADTGTRFGLFRLALLGDLETLQFGLYGTAQIGFPSLGQPHVLRLRAAVEALYDHRARMARFSFTLIEALLFERVHLTGGAALLIRWGARDEFAMTLGGFHPAFRPFIPDGLREPPRLGAYWKPHRLVELSIKAYFAVTTTSLQFGYAAHVEAGASWGGFRADTEFNFLMMTEPDLRFEIDLSFRVTVFLFGADLISASLSGSMVGPCPWVLEGSVYWEVCGVSISKDFGPYEWGERRALPTTAQDAGELLATALEDSSNWTIRRGTRLPVRLRPGSDDALDPRDQIDVRQTRLPLGVALEVHDANPLNDPGTWTLQPATGGLAKLSDLTEVFPTRRYLKRPPKEAPFRGGLVAGARVGGQGWTFPAALAIESDESETEGLVLDSLPPPPKRERLEIRVPLGDAVLVAAPTGSPERKWTRHVMRLETVA